ncbi:PAS domain-containing protein [Azospirillum sp. sgz302134]
MIKERTELATPHLSGLLDFWLTKCIGDKPPVSSTIAPADLWPWKDNIVIFEVIGEDDFVYSYYGKALAEAFGHSRLGATLDELPEEQRAILRPEYESVRRERLPVARVYTADFNGVTRTWERLALPMSSDGELIDKLLVAAYELTDGDAPLAEQAPLDDIPEEASDITEEPPAEEPVAEAVADDPADGPADEPTAEGEPDEDEPDQGESDTGPSDDTDPAKPLSTDLNPGAPA